ncbi:MAG: DoxX family protein [Tannerella sp.]|jgi:uncharacterized membrane protein YphA (DoxX/SURF4 family)|nr:DoxX family protein [Tannerella sp.]
MNKKRRTKVLAELCRILLGIIFIFSGFVKAVDPVGFSIKIEEYLSAFELDFFSLPATFMAFCIISVEFALGVSLLLGVYRRWISIGIFLLMCVMTPLTLVLAVFNPVADCGCFGDALVISNWETFFKNVILFIAAVIVLIYHRRLLSFYTHKVYGFVALFSLLFCMGFCYYNYSHLPVIDFRPYKVGKNITQLMEIPEDAPRDEYHFIYRKDGVEKEFSLEDVPVGDDSWTYVDAKLVKQGFIPVVSSFELYDKDQQNVADVILNDPRILFLLIAPELDHASDKHIDAINNIYDYARENELPFFAATSSSDVLITEWKKHTGADYSFLTADDVLLKTIIRSNPGLVLLKEGTILAKWHHNDIPEEEQLKEIIPDYAAASFTATKENRLWTSIILGFTLPLLTVWVYDFFRNRNLRKKTDSYIH